MPKNDEEIELWRDPAMLRLQPGRMRLWVAYAFLPLLGTIVVLLTPHFNLAYLEPLIAPAFPPNVPRSVPAVIAMNGLERTLARLFSFVIAITWGFGSGLQWTIVTTWSLNPLRRRLYRSHFRSELRLARLSSHDFLYALVRPHIPPLLLSCSIVVILGCAQLSLIPTHYGVFEISDYLLCIFFALLFGAMNLCTSAMEDFKPFSDQRALPQHMKQFPLVLAITSVALAPSIYYAATELAELEGPHRLDAFRPGGDLFIPFNVQVLIIVVIIAMLAGLSRILWRRTCRYLEDVE